MTGMLPISTLKDKLCSLVKACFGLANKMRAGPLEKTNKVKKSETKHQPYLKGVLYKNEKEVDFVSLPKAKES